MSWLDLPARSIEKAWVVFGAPVDVATSGESGTRHGPRFVRHAAPQWLHRKPSHQALLQINLTVLATAHAVSESIMRGVSQELARKATPQGYGASGKAAAPTVSGQQPLTLSRVL